MSANILLLKLLGYCTNRAIPATSNPSWKLN